MPKSLLRASTLMLVFVSSPVSAAETLDLSLEAAVIRARLSAPAVRTAERVLAETQAQRAGVGVFLPTNPKLYGEARPAAGGVWGFAASLELQTEISGASVLRVREAESRAKAAAAELALSRFAAGFDAAHAYVGAQAAQARVQALTIAVATAARIAHAAGELQRAGAGTDIDVGEATVQHAEFQAERAAALADFEEALRVLADLVDLVPDTSLALSTPLAEDPLAGAQTIAEGSRPELVAIAARGDAYGATHSRSRREGWPKIGLLVGIDAAPASPTFGQLGLSIELPFAQRQQGPRAAAAAAQATEAMRLSLTERRLARDQRARWLVLSARAAELNVLTTTAVPAAQHSYDIVERGWRSGRFDIFRLTTAAHELERLALRRIAALERAWLERIDLDRLTRGAL